MAKNWLSGKWLDLAKQRWDEWDNDKEDTSAYWKERIPNIHDLEKRTIDEVVAIVAGVLYPDLPVDFKEHEEIANLYKVITYYRTMKYNLGTCLIGPNIRGLNVPGYEDKLYFKWDEEFRYEDWDWVCNDLCNDKYRNALNRVITTNEPITRQKNFYGAKFDEYPMFIAARRNAENAILASFVLEDFKKENIKERAQIYLDKLESENKKEEMYRFVIDEMNASQYLSSIPDEQLIGLMVWFKEHASKANRFIDLLHNHGIWELYKNEEVFRDIVKLARIKKIMAS